MRFNLDVFAGIEWRRLYTMAKAQGFDGFFTGESYANDAARMAAVRELTDALGLNQETSHSTIPGSNTIWYGGEAGDAYMDVLLGNIDVCRQFGIPILVVHVTAGGAEPDLALGIGRLERAVTFAKEAGVKLAFENINHPELLFETLAHFTDAHVGFCYDIGHEACYTPGVRFLPRVGGRLICTHLHDNDGQGDQHLIPFDGGIDFALAAKELGDCGYAGDLTLELNYCPYAGKLSEAAYIEKCRQSLEKFRGMIDQ